MSSFDDCTIATHSKQDESSRMRDTSLLLCASSYRRANVPINDHGKDDIGVVGVSMPRPEDIDDHLNK